MNTSRFIGNDDVAVDILLSLDWKDVKALIHVNAYLNDLFQHDVMLIKKRQDAMTAVDQIMNDINNNKFITIEPTNNQYYLFKNIIEPFHFKKDEMNVLTVFDSIIIMIHDDKTYSILFVYHDEVYDVFKTIGLSVKQILFQLVYNNMIKKEYTID